MLNDVALNQVAVATRDGDAATRALLAQVRAEGRAFPSVGVWRGRAILRFSVSSGRSTDADADATVDAVAGAWADVRGRAA